MSPVDGPRPGDGHEHEADNSERSACGYVQLTIKFAGDRGG